MPTRRYGKEEIRLLEQVVASQKMSVLAGGTMQRRFEQAFAKAHGAKYGVAMNSAMSVLHASLITAGVGPGDEVLCDPVCVFGALAVLYAQGKPVFVDCKPVTFNMDPDLVEAAVTSRTKAMIVTHVGGLPAEIDRIMRTARKHKVVIEDAAHAFRATYKGKYAGTLGDIGSFSFQASKQLATGDGGMAVTNKKRLADAIGLHAGAPTFLSVAYGVHYNYRMNEPTAAVGLAQLPKITKDCEEIMRIAGMWDAAIEDCPWLVAQRGPEWAQSTYHLWIATFEGAKHGVSMARFRRALVKHGASFAVGYTKRAAYRHPAIENALPKGTYPKGLCPNAEHMVPRMVIGYPMQSLTAARRAASALRKVVKDLT
jgi:perosamine synthetase